MMRCARLLHWAAVAGLLGLVPTLYAQARVAHYDRPSGQSASQRLGLVGGTYTFTPGSLTDPQRLQRQGVNPSVASFNAHRPTRRQQVGRTPSVLRLGQIPAPQQRNLMQFGALTSAQIGASSGFYQATSVTTPIYGYGAQMVPEPRQIPIMELPELSEFHRYFGLVEAPPDTPPDQPKTFPELMDELQAETTADAAAAQREALTLFRELTGGFASNGEPVPDTHKPLMTRRAIRLLTSARDLARDRESDASAPSDAYVPDLLLVHVYLERYRAAGLEITSALNSLLTAARHDPEVFHKLSAARTDPSAWSDVVPLAAYFGDYRDGRSEALDRQMRQYLQAVAAQPASVDTLMLEAYCAWVLEDSSRARQALERAELELKRKGTGTRDGQERAALLAALEYAL